MNASINANSVRRPTVNQRRHRDRFGGGCDDDNGDACGAQEIGAARDRFLILLE
jgi:hypothetical protein